MSAEWSELCNCEILTRVKAADDDDIRITVTAMTSWVVGGAALPVRMSDRQNSVRLHCNYTSRLRIGELVSVVGPSLSLQELLDHLMGTGNYSATSNNMKLEDWAAARSGSFLLYQM